MSAKIVAAVHGDCTHHNPHRHGTRACALAHHCSCQACSTASARYATRRAVLIAEGRWRPHVDAAPVRAHVRRLREAGLTLGQIAAAASSPRTGRLVVKVSTSTLEALLYGRTRDGATVQVKQVRTNTARAILSVLVPDDDLHGALDRAVNTLRQQPGWDDRRVSELLLRATPAIRSAVVRSTDAGNVLVSAGADSIRRALDKASTAPTHRLSGPLSDSDVAQVQSVLEAVLPRSSSPQMRTAAVAILKRAGLSATQAAQVLQVSPRTVERHLAAARR